MGEKLLTLQEAKELAKEYMKIPDETIRDINKLIVVGVGDGRESVTYFRPDIMNAGQWRAIQMMLRANYHVTEKSCQRDGSWLVIHLSSPIDKHSC